MGDIDRAAAAERRALLGWQKSLRPLLVLVLLGLSAFFFTASYVQFGRMESALQADQQSTPLEEMFAKPANPDETESAADFEKRGRLLLEARAQIARERRLNSALLVSAWTRNLGFVTGMVLSIMGGAFILARLSEGATALSAESGAVKGALSTSSPGIVLCVLGSVLMLVAMSVRYEVDVMEPVAAPAAAESSAEGDDGLGPPPPPYKSRDNATEG